MTLQGFSSRSKQGLYRSLQAFGAGTPPSRILTSIVVANGKVFVGDRQNLKVVVYDLAGVKLDEWGTSGTSAGEFNATVAVLGWHNNELYVSDSTGVAQNRCQVFSESGTYNRTILTDVSSFDIYNGEIFYSKLSESLGGFTIRRVDTSGTAIGSFSVSDADLLKIDTNSGSLVLGVSTVTYSGIAYSLGVYQYDFDGVFISFIDAENYSAGEEILVPSIRTSPGSLYSGVGSSLRLHNLSGAFFDSESMNVTPSRNRIANFQYYDSGTDARLYYAVNYSDTLIQPKIEIYEADVLTFFDEWDAI